MVFLITAIGSMSAFFVISSLRRNYSNCTIIGTDTNKKEYIYLAKHVDFFYEVPVSSNSDYLDHIMAILNKHSVDVVIPLIDYEVDELSGHFYREKDNLGTVLAVSDYPVVKLCRDKSHYSELFKDAVHFKSISNITHHSLDSSKRYIAKEKTGRSSRNMLSFGPTDTFPVVAQNYIIQEYLEGEIVTVDVIKDNYGNIYSIPRKELIRTLNGAGLSVVVFQSEKIDLITEEIVAKIDIRGCVNIEFIHQNNSYYLLDINPRFSAGVSFSNKAGYDFVNNHIRVFLNEEIDRMKPIKCGYYYKITNDAD